MATETEQEFYRKALQEGTTDAQRNGYVHSASQTERFKEFLGQLRRAGVFQGYSLLDVGCGTGDLLGFLEGVGLGPEKYVGIDAMSEMVERARHELLGRMHSGSWEVHEGDANWPIVHDNEYDVVACISAYAFKNPESGMEWGLEYVQSRIATMADIAKKLVFVTLFSTWAAQLHPLGECLAVIGPLRPEPTTRFTDPSIR